MSQTYNCSAFRFINNSPV